MVVEQRGKILTAESKPYNVNGNEGISHRVRILIDGEIFSAKATDGIVKNIKQYEGADGVVRLDFTSRKENLNLAFVDFSPD